MAFKDLYVHVKKLEESGKLPQGAKSSAEIRNDAVSRGIKGARSFDSIPPIEGRSETEVKKLNLQEKKEKERSASFSPLEARKNLAKKEYDDYVKSDAYKKKLDALYEKERQELFQRNLANSFAGRPMEMLKPPEDPEEIRLRAARDQAEADYNAEEDRKVIKQDLEAITGLSSKERQQLEQYAVNQIRDQNLPIEMQGVMPTARQEASALIGKYGSQRVDELAESFMRQENADMARKVDEKSREFADKHGVLGSIATIPVNAVSGVVGTVGQLQGMARSTGRYQTLDPYATGTIGDTFSGAVRGQVQQNIEEGLGDGLLGKAASIGYQGIMSAADSVARAFLGGGAVGGAALAATNSFSQTMAEASRNGATPAQAALLATATAGIEALSEKIPLDNLIKTAKGGNLSSILKNALAQMGIEAATEEISLLGTVLAEAAILQEKSAYNRKLTGLLLNHVPLEEARRQANMEIINEAVNTALVSMVSGGLSSLGGSYADARGMFAEKQEQNNPVLNQPTGQATQGPQQSPKAQNSPAAKPMQAKETSEQATNQASAPQTDTRTDVQPRANAVQEQSAEGGRIKGTGAAEVDFSGKPSYYAILSEDNAQPDRKTDVRPMELPEQDINGRDVSAVTANVYGSQNTPDDLAEAMEEPVARGDFSYVRITNDAATQRAQKSIGDAGSWESARDGFRMDVDKGLAGAELSARGALILNHAAEVYQQAKESGDMQAAARAKREWLTILSDVQKLGTNTAQGMQAMKIIRNLMPQDKLQFAQIAVENMVRDMRLDNAIQIDQQLITEYENATTDQQRDEVMEKIQQNVADQIPSTMLDKWNALRYTNMLGNLKTTVGNVAGNVGNTAVYRLKDAVGATIEAIANKVTKGKTGRTKSAVVNKQLQRSLDDYYQQVKSTINSGGKYGEGNTAAGDFAQGVMEKRRIFKSNSKNETVRKAADFAMAPMEGYRKATNWMMNNDRFGDEAFGKAAFTHAMAGYLQANGVKTAADIKNADPDLIDKAMTYAVKEAQEVTFHDNSALANALGRIKKASGVFGEGIMPFTKTPANVLTRAEEYSPLGIINTAILSAQKAAGNTKLAEGNGLVGRWAAGGQDITGTDIVNSLSKSLTGAGIFALGAILKSHGILNGGPDEDEAQAAFDQMNGQQPYSINLPDGTNYTLDWLTPVAMPLFMGAQFMEIAADKDLTFADLERVFTSIADPMLQMSMLQGMNDSLENIKYSENNLGQFFINAAVSYLTQGLTNTLLGQLERSTEENRQTTYVDKNSNVPEWMQRQLGKASQKIPGWDYQQMDYRNNWGETEQNEGGAGYNLLSPGYSGSARTDSVTEELNRLRSTTKETIFPTITPKVITYTDKSGNVHKDYQLSQEEFQKIATTQGQTAKQIIEDMIASENYKAMSDQEKAKAIKQVYSYAREKGMVTGIKNHAGYSESWMAGLRKGSEADVILRRVTNSELNRTMANLDAAWDNGYSTEGKSRELAAAYDSYSKMTPEQKREVKHWATGTVAKYIEARERGISHDDFLKAAKNVGTVKGTGKPDENTGVNDVRDIDRRQAIAETTGLSDAEIDRIMWCYMPDYDPANPKSDKTELKYNYIRKEMGLSPEEYAQTYRASLDNSKRKDKIAAIMALGYDRRTATTLYNIYASNDQGKKLYMEFYENG